MSDFQPQLSKAIILLVEDSPTQAAMVKASLTGAGLQVFWAANGVEGLRMVEQVWPDVIVLDMEMPEMNGLEACRHLKENPHTAKIPIIMFSRHNDPRIEQASLELGITEFVPKDVFANAVLVETLRAMGFVDEGWRAPED